MLSRHANGCCVYYIYYEISNAWYRNSNGVMYANRGKCKTLLRIAVKIKKGVYSTSGCDLLHEVRVVEKVPDGASGSCGFEPQ